MLSIRITAMSSEAYLSKTLEIPMNFEKMTKGEEPEGIVSMN